MDVVLGRVTVLLDHLEIFSETLAYFSRGEPHFHRPTNNGVWLITLKGSFTLLNCYKSRVQLQKENSKEKPTNKNEPMINFLKKR